MILNSYTITISQPTSGILLLRTHSLGAQSSHLSPFTNPTLHLYLNLNLNDQSRTRLFYMYISDSSCYFQHSLFLTFHRHAEASKVRKCLDIYSFVFNSPLKSQFLLKIAIDFSFIPLLISHLPEQLYKFHYYDG